MFFLSLKFSYILVEGPLEVFNISKINGKCLHGPVRGPNQTLNRINIYKTAYIIISFCIILYYSACVGKFNIYIPIFFGFLSTIYFHKLPLRYKILLITIFSTLVFILLYIS